MEIDEQQQISVILIAHRKPFCAIYITLALI